MAKKVKGKIPHITKTAIYVRVSTEEQAKEGFSIRAQAEKLKTYALLKEWDIYDLYTDDGISGKNIIDRPEINRLIKDVREGNVNNVLVFKIDRLTRSIKNLMELVELFDEHNCSFNSLTESIDTETPSGRMFLKIIGIFAEFERENLASRVTLGFERKVKEGYSLSSFGTSYGYDIQKGERIQKIVPSEAKIVKEIFDMYVKENMSMLGITKELVRRNIKTKKSSSKWNKSTIKNMLQNPNYIGKVRYGTQDESRYFETEGQHEPIIDEETFKLAQERLERNKNVFITNVPKEDKYFCGVLYCGMCGSRFSTQQNSHTRKDGSKHITSSYKCSGIMYDDCKMPCIIHHKIDNAFHEYIQNINALEPKNAELKRRETADKKRILLEYIASCEKKLAIQKKRKQQVMEQYMNGDISFDDYKQLLHISNEQYIALSSEIDKSILEMPLDSESKITTDDIITNLTENWERLENKERAIFLQRFTKKIIVNAERINLRSSTVSIKSIEFNVK